MATLCYIVLQLLFWLSAIALFHSYLLYPLLLRYLAHQKQLNTNIYHPQDEELPTMIVVMAVYNEIAVIEAKLKSIVETNYPLNRLQVWIGSDNSTDGTNEVIERYVEQYPFIRFQVFEGRNGKISIINQLIGDGVLKGLHLLAPILVMTDANVLFTPDLLYQLAKHFKNKTIGLVGANVQNFGPKQQGISFQEQWYIQRENSVKYHEGLVWGNMMGAFGACYAMRADLFMPVPQHFIVDDFYLTMRVLEKGKQSIKEPAAICYEDVSTDIWEEFRRKKRISAGNFQNLSLFRHFLLPKYGSIAFSFWSHKVIRWFGPVLFIIALTSSAVLAGFNYFYASLFSLQLLVFFLPLVDYGLQKQGIHHQKLRFITYFQSMNVALFIGLFNYLKGIKNNVWTPTKRNTD